VDRKLDLAFEQGALDLTDEARLVVEGGSDGGAGSALVARGPDRDELGVAERLGHRARLRQRQGAAAGTDPQRGHGRRVSPAGARMRGAAA
jgi:hypothetical protein